MLLFLGYDLSTASAYACNVNMLQICVCLLVLGGYLFGDLPGVLDRSCSHLSLGSLNNSSSAELSASFYNTHKNLIYLTMKSCFSNLYRALIIINFASIVTKKINKLKNPYQSY